MEQNIDNQFLEKLRSLGVQVGTSKIDLQKPDQYSIRDVIDGYDIATSSGIAFAADKIYPKGTLHGNIDLFGGNDIEIIQKWAKIPQIHTQDLGKLLFLDTETSSLAGGAGTFVFMVGLGFYTGNNFKVVQLFLEDPEEELSFLSALETITAGFTTLVTFNGKSFDFPVLRNRYLFTRNPNPFEDFYHIDLLHLARRIWKNRLDSCRLSELEQQILGFRRSEEEIPGWLVPEIYHDYLYNRDARPLAGVFYHNQNDIVSMAALACAIAKMLSNPYEIEEQDDIFAIGKLMDDLSIYTSAQDIYEHCSKLNLPVEKEIDLLLRAARLHQRRSNWGQAVMHWEAASKSGSITACIELSKYFEHQKKEFEIALKFAQTGLNLAPKKPGKNNVQPLRNEIERRILRIQGKILKGQGNANRKL